MDDVVMVEDKPTRQPTRKSVKLYAGTQRRTPMPLLWLVLVNNSNVNARRIQDLYEQKQKHNRKASAPLLAPRLRLGRLEHISRSVALDRYDEHLSRSRKARWLTVPGSSSSSAPLSLVGTSTSTRIWIPGRSLSATMLLERAEQREEEKKNAREQDFGEQSEKLVENFQQALEVVLALYKRVSIGDRDVTKAQVHTYARCEVNRLPVPTAYPDS